MKCVYCDSPTRVYESRLRKDNIVRRRRECDKCHTRYTTFETIERVDAHKKKIEVE